MIFKRSGSASERRQKLRLRLRLGRPPQIKGLSLNVLIPNILTLLALCMGLTAIRFALHQEWKFAVAAILLAGVLDGMDGRVARLLHGTSKFGAELDSLSDFVSFGVAPALVLYLWSLQTMAKGGPGWAIALLFAVCCGMRLARFNTMIGVANPPAYAAHFFTGIPAPAAAGIAVWPMVAHFQFGDDLPGVFNHPLFVSGIMLLVAVLMVSTIPTFSFKKVRVPHRWVLPILLLVGLLVAFLVTDPWATLVVVGGAYLALIPLSIRSFHRLRGEAEAAEATLPSSDGQSSPES